MLGSAAVRIAAMQIADVRGIEATDVDIAQMDVTCVHVSAMPAEPDERQQELADDKRSTDDSASEK